MTARHPSRFAFDSFRKFHQYTIIFLDGFVFMRWTGEYNDGCANNDTTAGKSIAMKRRTFLSQAAGAAAVAIATPAIAQSGQVRWRMTTSWPKSLDTIQGSAELMSQRIAQLTEGKFQVGLFAAGEIVPGTQVF